MTKVTVNENYMHPPVLEGYVYSYEEAKACRDNNQLLTIRLETSRICNLKCDYCCNQSGQKLEGEISYETLLDLVLQAKDLGAKSIIVIGGGEPTIYDKFRELISFINKNGLIPVIFTNTQTMTEELASFLYNHNASVIIKLDSLDSETQDRMVGVKGASRKIKIGLQNLLNAGYANIKARDRLKLGASFVVNRDNASEVPEIWRFCRINNIFPNLEMMIPNGNGYDILGSILTSTEWGKLKTDLLSIDRAEFGYDWFPYTPLVGASCFQVMYNLYITVLGDVRPCSSIHCSSYNIYQYKLKEIIDIPFFNIARHIEENLTGKCAECDRHSQCIGCRGLSFSVNKNRLEEIRSLCSEDPSCDYFRNKL